MTENQQTPQDQREAQERRREEQQNLNAWLHNRPNVVRADRITTRDQLNAAIRKAAGRGGTGDDAA